MKTIPFAIGIIIFLAFLYLLLFGRLAPYSPYLHGFEENVAGRAAILHPSDLPTVRMPDLDPLMVKAEKFYGLKFLEPPQLVLCGTDSQYRRLTGTKARFIAIPVQWRIFISRRAWDEAARGDIDISIYLSHELAHTLVQQHSSILTTITMPRWYLEGSAMACARQTGTGIYPSAAEIKKIVSKGLFFHPDDFGTWIDSKHDREAAFPLENRIAFFYSQFGCLVDDMISRYGKEKFFRFTKMLVKGEESRKSFNMEYGLDMDAYLVIFKNSCREQRLR